MPMSGLLLSNGLLGRYSGPEVRTWEVSEPETFSMVGIILSQKMCPILCHPTDTFAQLYTASHMLRALLSCCFSSATLKTEDLFWMGLLPWAQEAPGSNPGAPTILCFFSIT